LQYERNDLDFKRGSFRIKGDTLDIFPAYKEQGIRIEFFDDTIEKIYEFKSVSGKKNKEIEKINIYPAKHFIISKDKVDRAFKTIRSELKERLSVLNKEGKLLEAQRLNQRTNFDLEMLAECGYCHGIENYSRHLSQKVPGSRPYCLIVLLSQFLFLR